MFIYIYTPTLLKQNVWQSLKDQEFNATIGFTPRTPSSQLSKTTKPGNKLYQCKGYAGLATTVNENLNSHGTAGEKKRKNIYIKCKHKQVTFTK